AHRSRRQPGGNTPRDEHGRGVAGAGGACPARPGAARPVRLRAVAVGAGSVRPRGAGARGRLRGPMGRPVTLFTGQWAALPLASLAEKAGAWDFDGLELACWGDHFEVDRALFDPGYVESRRP